MQFFLGTKTYGGESVINFMSNHFFLSAELIHNEIEKILFRPCFDSSDNIKSNNPNIMYGQSIRK